METAQKIPWEKEPMESNRTNETLTTVNNGYGNNSKIRRINGENTINRGFKDLNPDFLCKAKKGYVCPLCGNGTGNTGTGLEKDPNTGNWHCFKCGLSADVADLIGLHFGITDYKEKIRKAEEYYGECPNGDGTACKTMDSGANDYTSFYAMAEASNDYSYLLKRGISRETQDKFHVGLVPQWRSPQAVQTILSKGGDPDKLPAGPRCIIPRSSSCYFARDTREDKDIPPEQFPYKKQNQGKPGLYNTEVLKDTGTVFITEGEIDCMSIYEAGGHSAIALCGTSNIGKLLSYVRENHVSRQRFALMLDNDPAGRKAQKELLYGLEQSGIAAMEINYPGDDPNDCLIHWKEQMSRILSSVQDGEWGCCKENHLGNSTLEDRPICHTYTNLDTLAYFDTIEHQKPEFEAKTGFPSLDAPEKNLYGGLHEGLYIIGAVPSLGKTSLMLQMADQIAKNGNSVLFFALEQPKKELTAKSISRETYLIHREKKGQSGKPLAKDTIHILNPSYYAWFSMEEKQAIKRGRDAYRKYAGNIYIKEGWDNDGNRIGMDSIKKTIEDYICKTGRKPVVFIDYMQVIAPYNQNATDKQNMDKILEELKGIPIKHGIPVFAISSFNRDNYDEPVSLASFKESGSIEYAGDFLFGLQMKGWDYVQGEGDRERKQRLSETREKNEKLKKGRFPIELELKCLKNRNGMLFTVSFGFMAAYNCYEDKGDGESLQETDRRREQGKCRKQY